MSVVERWTRPNKQTLRYQATVTDFGAYTRPFTVAWEIPFDVTSEMPEYICQENNLYLNRLTDDFRTPDLRAAASTRRAAARHHPGTKWMTVAPEMPDGRRGGSRPDRARGCVRAVRASR
jgi:hypothetical protein